jgi:diacylglycerol kinase family enzyme
MEKNSKNNMLAIFNGRNFSNKRIGLLLQFIENQSIDYIFTSKKDHVEEILRTKSNYEGYLVFGGDGSIHETVNYLFGKDKWMSFFPGGTVNCIAGYFKMKRTVPFLKTFLQNNQIQQFDLIKVNFYRGNYQFTKYVLGFITIGHLTSMTINAEKYRWMPRFIRYPYVGFLSFFCISRFSLAIQSENRPPIEIIATSLIINNCSAERFSSLQKSDFKDGKFEYLIENNNSLSQIASIYSQFYSVFSKSKWETTNNDLTFTFGKPIPVMADGEIYENITRIDLSIQPSSQKIKLPVKK